MEKPSEKRTERCSRMPVPTTVIRLEGHHWISMGLSSAVWDLTILGYPDLGTCSMSPQLGLVFYAISQGAQSQQPLAQGV